MRDQTLRALDLVVVDDCSTDRSLSVATDWAEKNAGRFNRICVLKNRSNHGLAMCRNSGFDAADTPYVLPLDPDNKLLPQCCEILLNTIRTSGAAFAYSTIRRFGDGDGLVSAVGYDAQRFVGSNYIDAMALVSKEAWATVGGYHHIQVAGWEDYDFWCRLAEHGLAGVWHSDVLALYRVHGTSMLQTHTMVPVNHRRLVEDFITRHPWVSLTRQEQLLQRPRQAVRLSERPEFRRLRVTTTHTRAVTTAPLLRWADVRVLSIGDWIRPDLDVLITVDRFRGADAVKRFRFVEAPEQHDLSLMESLLQKFRSDALTIRHPPAIRSHGAAFRHRRPRAARRAPAPGRVQEPSAAEPALRGPRKGVWKAGRGDGARASRELPAPPEWRSARGTCATCQRIARGQHSDVPARRPIAATRHLSKIPALRAIVCSSRSTIVRSRPSVASSSSTRRTP